MQMKNDSNVKFSTESEFKYGLKDFFQSEIKLKEQYESDNESLRELLDQMTMNSQVCEFENEEFKKIFIPNWSRLPKRKQAKEQQFYQTKEFKIFEKYYCRLLFIHPTEGNLSLFEKKQNEIIFKLEILPFQQIGPNIAQREITLQLISAYPDERIYTNKNFTSYLCSEHPYKRYSQELFLFNNSQRKMCVLLMIECVFSEDSNNKLYIEL